MKIKVVLVKYFDWVILAALAVGLVYALFQTFLVEDSAVRELRDEIDRSIRTTERDMKKPEAEPPETKDHLASLKRRFVQPPVLSTYTKNPFRPGPFIPKEPLQLWKGDPGPAEVVFRDIRIVQIPPYPEENLKVTYSFDAEVGDTVVKIMPRATGDTYVTFLDDQGTVYGMRVYVREKRKLPEPLGPASPYAEGYPTTEDAEGKRQPAKVLIACAPRNPQHASMDYGIATHVVIERKIEGRTDEEYVVVTSAYSEGRMPMLTAEQAVVLRREFGIDETATETDETGVKRTPVRQPPPRGAGFGEAMEATDYERRRLAERDAGTGRGARQDEGGEKMLGLGELLRQGNFTFVDRTVDEGESYVYRVWTVAVSEGVPSTRCREAYQFSGIYVHPMVEFAFTSVSGAGSSVSVVRQRPGGTDTVEETFRITHGQLIGGKIVRKEYLEGAGEGRSRRYRLIDLDFSTGAVLVSGVSGVKEIEYRLRDDWQNNRVLYKIRLRSSPRAVYLTQRNSLRWQEKESDQRGIGDGAAGQDTPGRSRGRTPLRGVPDDMSGRRP